MNREQVVCSDCLEYMRTMPENSVDSIVTDPPYGLSFMNKEWDSFGTDTRQPGDEHYWVPDNPYGRSKARYGWNQDKSKLASSNRAFQESMTYVFEEALRVAKPGAHLLCFGGTRTFHRMACAIEDAGWEIRDCIMWVYGSGFPKSMDVGKAIDKAIGAERTEVIGTRHRNVKPFNDENGWNANNTTGDYEYKAPATDAAAQWDGWGTCLKPAWEPIIVARKPLDGTVAHNVLTWGVGAMNIDACRVAIEHGDDVFSKNPHTHSKGKDSGIYGTYKEQKGNWSGEKGRFPANLVHDGSQMVLDLFPDTGKSSGGGGVKAPGKNGIYGTFNGHEYPQQLGLGDSGSAARFFYCAKASKKDRGDGNNHPTVKPTELMKWLVQLVTPEGGVVLDPFAGSGTTLVAAKMLGRGCIGIEREKEYVEIIKRRLETA